MWAYFMKYERGQMLEGRVAYNVNVAGWWEDQAGRSITNYSGACQRPHGGNVFIVKGHSLFLTPDELRKNNYVALPELWPGYMNAL